MPGAAAFSMPGQAKPTSQQTKSSEGAGATSSLPPPSDLPSLGAGGPRTFGGLGGVHGRAGAFDYDEKFLLNAKRDLAKLN